MNSERGMTMVELIVAISVMSILLLGIGSALYVGYRAAGAWEQRITQAQTINQLSSSLDQDVHRYVPCGSGGELDLCRPTGTDARDWGIVYKPSGNGPFKLVRTDWGQGGRETVVARGLAAAPSFSVSCDSSGSVDTGYIRVGLSPQPFVVYFRAPHGGCPQPGGSHEKLCYPQADCPCDYLIYCFDRRLYGAPAHAGECVRKPRASHRGDRGPEG